MNDETSNIKLLGCIFLLAMIPVNMFISGLVLSSIWGWFLVPLGLPHITKLHAIGIFLVVSLLTTHLKPQDFRNEDTTSDRITAAVSWPIIKLFIWGVAYLVALFGGFA